MTPTVVVVGCGFVGSIFTTEFLKLMYAGKLPFALRFIDSDTVEERNAANQNFRLLDAGKPKALVMAKLAEDNGREGQWERERLDAGNMEALTADANLVVDAVDNMATRQLLWGFGMADTPVPVLHIGIALEGTGNVEWTHPKHDTFSLAPHKVYGQKIVDPESGVTPPCELVRMRAVGWNTSYAAAVAAALYFGFDPSAHLGGRPSQGWLTEWAGRVDGHFPVRDTWAKV